jgi:hypothetical protein
MLKMKFVFFNAGLLRCSAFQGYDDKKAGDYKQFNCCMEIRFLRPP